MPQIVCPGCSHSFTHGAWSLHIAQTDNPPCRAIYDEQKAYLPGAGSSNDNADPSLPPGDINFGGDFFGAASDYGEEDFPGWEEDHDLLSDPPSDSESDWDELEPNLGGESQAPTQTSAPPPDIDDPMDDERGRPITCEERRKAAESLRTKPVIVRFPSARAGEVIQDEEQSGYEAYGKQLGTKDGGNAYAPFHSKLDWDFARWAKLRGPGSTAATELMGIDGVRHGVLYIYAFL